MADPFFGFLQAIGFRISKRTHTHTHTHTHTVKK